MKTKSSIRTYLSKSLQSSKTTQDTEKLSLLCKGHVKDTLQECARNYIDHNSDLSVVPDQNDISGHNMAQSRNHDYYWTQDCQREFVVCFLLFFKLFTSSFLTYLHTPTLQAPLLAERSTEHRLVSVSSQQCQVATDFQEDEDIITWQILRNIIAI